MLLASYMGMKALTGWKGNGHDLDAYMCNALLPVYFLVASSEDRGRWEQFLAQHALEIHAYTFGVKAIYN